MMRAPPSRRRNSGFSSLYGALGVVVVSLAVAGAAWAAGGDPKKLTPVAVAQPKQQQGPAPVSVLPFGRNQPGQRPASRRATTPESESPVCFLATGSRRTHFVFRTACRSAGRSLNR